MEEGSPEDRARAGDRTALASLLEEQHAALRHWIEGRLDRRVRGRVSASDVLQEVYVAADQRLDHFAKLTNMPFPVWARLLASQRLIEVHRRYLQAEARAVERELPMDAGGSSEGLAARLSGPFTTPSRVAMRHEQEDALEWSLAMLNPSDREVIELRHFQCLSNEDTAARLGLTRNAATKRYVRALARLKLLMNRHSAQRDTLS